jgi:hydrogenase nickel incorporation protein HypA/HybF
MHERSLMRALLRQVDNIAAEHPASRVVQIRIRVGEFAGVEADLLTIAYDDAIEETPFRGAELALERVPLTATCDDCGRAFRIERFNFFCDACGSRQLSVQGGEELLLESVVMEENDP